jgi:hypothetical protein
VRVEASDGGARLVLLVDPARHVVVAAGHGGAGEPSLSGCLDRVCALLEGQPIQDGADHAVLRVERATRGEGPAPVPGIVTPENAGEPFPHAQRLVRAALARYREASGYAATENRHRPGPSESWTGKDDAARMEAIRAVLPRICVAIGLDPTEVIAEEVLDRVRLRIGFAAGVPFAVRRRALDSIERALQAEVEPTLTVEIEARRDQSKLRRL